MGQVRHCRMYLHCHFIFIGRGFFNGVYFAGVIRMLFELYSYIR